MAQGYPLPLPNWWLSPTGGTGYQRNPGTSTGPVRGSPVREAGRYQDGLTDGVEVTSPLGAGSWREGEYVTVYP